MAISFVTEQYNGVLLYKGFVNHVDNLQSLSNAISGDVYQIKGGNDLWLLTDTEWLKIGGSDSSINFTTESISGDNVSSSWTLQASPSAILYVKVEEMDSVNYLEEGEYSCIDNNISISSPLTFLQTLKIGYFTGIGNVVSGPVGPRGPQGFPGEQGPQGIQGLQGGIGPRGLQGIQGEKGDKGDKGDTSISNVNYLGLWDAGTVPYSSNSVAVSPVDGNAYVAIRSTSEEPQDGALDWTLFVVRGPEGEAGSKGPQGVQGLPGKDGVDGAQGIQGVQGPTGPQGDPGPEGPVGPQGVQGIAGTVGTIVGTFNSLTDLQTAVPTGTPGEFYYINPDLYVWDSTSNAWNNIGPIAGPQGIQGVEGPVGPPGYDGENGEQGEKGDKGDQGEKGDTGPVYSPNYTNFSTVLAASGGDSAISGATFTVDKDGFVLVGIALVSGSDTPRTTTKLNNLNATITTYPDLTVQQQNRVIYEVAVGDVIDVTSNIPISSWSVQIWYIEPKILSTGPMSSAEYNSLLTTINSIPPGVKDFTLTVAEYPDLNMVVTHGLYIVSSARAVEYRASGLNLPNPSMGKGFLEVIRKSAYGIQKYYDIDHDTVYIRMTPSADELAAWHNWKIITSTAI